MAGVNLVSTFWSCLANSNIFEVGNYDKVLCVCVARALHVNAEKLGGKRKILCSEHVARKLRAKHGQLLLLCFEGMRIWEALGHLNSVQKFLW